MATNLTLPISSLVNVTIDAQPKFLAKDIFNRLCVIGSSSNTRGTPSGVYTSMAGVEQHYEDTTNEHKIATYLFMQVPRPRSIMIATVEGIVYPLSE